MFLQEVFLGRHSIFSEADIVIKSKKPEKNGPEKENNKNKNNNNRNGCGDSGDNGGILDGQTSWNRKVPHRKCRTESAEISKSDAIAMQNEITETKGMVNAETFNTGVSDIRERLRKNWTIRD